MVRFFVQEAEGGKDPDTARVQQITSAMETEIFERISSMESVPDMAELFVKHYVSPVGAAYQKSVRTTDVSDR